ncbi:active breakpoint cluster region-related protein isoform X5 [Plutella xylostella]|uniref:active breakpoint cluster region-related protein isoform X4 n=1 Tax=Plutella xylostella TaxID=51655 RepID=UPI002032E3A2|nr:active breakpoint cluster region-related protein isoform X4 [Plutella xylostella]XP_048478634.1 active breakpoint cluster region-related protein isoform X5 [Plutella xylostella]
MSVFGDFQRVWVQRFPESALPAAWEEDVRANLAKHKQKVAILREELEKEEFYVEYLETLLSDVEKHKAASQGREPAAPLTADVNEPEDKDSDSKQGSNTNSLTKKNSDSIGDLSKSEESGNELADCEEVHLRAKPVRIGERSSVNQCINEISSCLTEAAARRRCNSEVVSRTATDKETNGIEQNNLAQCKNRPASQAGDFVTVIEVNGLKAAENAAKKAEESPQSPESSPVDSTTAAKKKVPPKPPPKVFSKRGASLPESDVAEDSPPSSLGRRMRAESRESIGSRASTPSISERVKSYESINSLSSERKRSGGAATPRSIDEEVTSTTPDLPVSNEVDKSAPASLESIPASTPIVEDEPYYDQVPADINDGEYVYIQAGGTGSSADDASSGTSTLPLSSRAPTAPRAPDSPPCTIAPNYVNIHYFIQQAAEGPEPSEAGSELADSSDTPLFLRTISSDTDASATPPALRKLHTQESSNSNAEAERLTMQRCIVTSIIESETVYVECLYVMEKYMNAIKATLSTSQPVITEEEFNTIFYKISELHELHKNFLEGLKSAVASWEEPLSVGVHFKKMAENINIYGAFLHNYGRATDAVRRRCGSSQRFSDLTRQIACRGQPMSLDDLLHKPVARVQKNALVLHDLIKYTPASHPDHAMLTDALNMTQHFLDEFNIIQTKSMFPNADRAQRRLVKNSFIVELSDGHRKLRHLFLFNDVIACAKYKASGREKFTFELKWFISLGDAVVAEDEGAEAREASPANIVALKSQACTVRDQICAEERAAMDDKKIRLGSRGNAEKQRKKLAELEGQLVLASPNLVFRVGARAPGGSGALQRQHVFFLSSEYERTQWIDSIHALQSSSAPPAGSNAISMLELQAWVTACRSYLQTDMGSYLLRSGRDDSLLLGDLQLHVGGMTGALDTSADYYIVVEVDSYGHYFRKAKSKLVCRSSQPRWNESFTLDLEGSQNLRLLLYEDAARPVLRGKCTLKLSRDWVSESASGGVSRTVALGGGSLALRLKLLPPEMTARRVPAAKPGALFGAKIHHVAKREKRNIPFVISACVREVERRGILEVGVYRVSGSASDLNRLKKSFETNAYEAEQLLKEVDIHSVTGVLKLYLRELPEALFTDALYPELIRAWGATQGAGASAESGPAHTRRHALLKCYSQLPDLNKNCIDFLLNHFVKVNQHESENKMSLHNLATVFGPTLLRPSASAGSKQRTDLLAAGTVDAMAQAGILYCLLQHRQLAAQLSSHHRAPALLD